MTKFSPLRVTLRRQELVLAIMVCSGPDDPAGACGSVQVILLLERHA